jgi:copper chaperone CopZ
MTLRKFSAVIVFALMIGMSTALAVPNTATVTIKVEGMHCENCASSIEKKLKATAGVEEVKVDLPKNETWVKYDDQKITVAKLREVINSTGFKAVEDKPQQ